MILMHGELFSSGVDAALPEAAHVAGGDPEIDAARRLAGNAVRPPPSHVVRVGDYPCSGFQLLQQLRPELEVHVGKKKKEDDCSSRMSVSNRSSFTNRARPPAPPRRALSLLSAILRGSISTPTPCAPVFCRRSDDRILPSPPRRSSAQVGVAAHLRQADHLVHHARQLGAQSASGPAFLKTVAGIKKNALCEHFSHAPYPALSGQARPSSQNPLDPLQPFVFVASKYYRSQENTR